MARPSHRHGSITIPLCPDQSTVMPGLDSSHIAGCMSPWRSNGWWLLRPGEPETNSCNPLIADSECFKLRVQHPAMAQTASWILPGAPVTVSCSVCLQRAYISKIDALILDRSLGVAPDPGELRCWKSMISASISAEHSNMKSVGPVEVGDLLTRLGKDLL